MQLEELRRRVRAIMDTPTDAARVAQQAYEAALDQLAADPGFLALQEAQAELVGAVFRIEMEWMLQEV